MSRVHAVFARETLASSTSDVPYCSELCQDLIEYAGIEASVPPNVYSYDSFITDELIVLAEYKPVNTNQEIDLVEKGLEVMFPNGPEGSSYKYSYDQFRKLFQLHFVDGLPASQASSKSGINPSTGSGYCRKARPEVEALRAQLGKKKETPVRRANQKLFDEHSKFLAEYYENNAYSTVNQALDKLCEEFPNFKISYNGLYNHLRRKCCVIIKKVETENKNKKKSFSEVAPLDFKEEVIFVTTATFYMYKRESFGWSRSSNGKEESVLAKEGGVFFTVLAAFCSLGVINVVLNTNVGGKKKSVIYSEFIKSVMDPVLQNKFRQDVFIVDSDLQKQIVNAQEEFSSRCVFTPVNSATIQFWDKFKREIRRHQIDDQNTMLPRLTEAATTITAENCMEWITYVNKDEI